MQPWLEDSSRVTVPLAELLSQIWARAKMETIAFAFLLPDWRAAIIANRRGRLRSVRKLEKVHMELQYAAVTDDARVKDVRCMSHPVASVSL